MCPSDRVQTRTALARRAHAHRLTSVFVLAALFFAICNFNFAMAMSRSALCFNDAPPQPQHAHRIGGKREQQMVAAYMQTGRGARMLLGGRFGGEGRGSWLAVRRQAADGPAPCSTSHARGPVLRLLGGTWPLGSYQGGV